MKLALLKPILSGAMALSLVGALAACDPNRPISKQTVGAGVGALAGVAIGSQIGSGGGRTAAMIVGGLLGALAGSENEPTPTLNSTNQPTSQPAIDQFRPE